MSDINECGSTASACQAYAEEILRQARAEEAAKKAEEAAAQAILAKNNGYYGSPALANKDEYAQVYFQNLLKDLNIADIAMNSTALWKKHPVLMKNPSHSQTNPDGKINLDANARTARATSIDPETRNVTFEYDDRNLELSLAQYYVDHSIDPEKEMNPQVKAWILNFLDEQDGKKNGLIDLQKAEAAVNHSSISKKVEESLQNQLIQTAGTPAYAAFLTLKQQLTGTGDTTPIEPEIPLMNTIPVQFDR